MKRHSFLLFGLLAVAAIVLSACQPAATPSPAPTEVVAAPTEAASEPVTLTVWTQEGEGIWGQTVNDLTRRFEEEHSGVTVELTTYTMEDLDKSVPLAMAQPDGPDIAQVNNGYAVMGNVVEAGLLLPLDSYADQYGWRDLISPGLMARMSFTPDGQEFGRGNLYGMAVTAEIVGVYYNKEIFAQNNLTVPTTFEEFEADLAALKEAGITPLAMSCSGACVTGIQTVQAVLHLTASREWLDDFAFGRPNVSYVTPETQQAAETAQAWEAAGYFTPEYAGLTDPELISIFAQGGAGVLIGGNWWASSIIEVAPNSFGFFVLPGYAGDSTPLSIGGLGFPYSISSHSAHPDVAAEYIDYLISQQAADTYASIGQLPSREISASEKSDVDTLLADIITAFETQNSNDRIGHYLDWAGPNMWDASKAATQELFAGRITPEEFAEQIEQVHASDVAARAQ